MWVYFLPPFLKGSRAKESIRKGNGKFFQVTGEQKNMGLIWITTNMGLVVKSKLPPRSGSSLEAVEAHP